MRCRVIHTDSREHLAAMDPCSVDAICTDGPYELGFMGRAWDSTGIVYDPEFWRLCLRVLKPGGHLVNFCATRTYHRMACAVEDAGFQIRDSLLWMYGSGFPKSLDISKAIDKAAGAEREVVGPRVRVDGKAPGKAAGIWSESGELPVQITAPATPEAQQWDGWGSALKPAHEPIVLARKPLAGTIAETVLEHGTGGLNVDGCRVGDEVSQINTYAGRGPFGESMSGNGYASKESIGRWPPNVLLSPETAAKLGDKASYFPVFDCGDEDRFFYAPKASRKEREAGCEHLPGRAGSKFKNPHPTVKPVSLMRWLCRLITPPKSLILDPFAGSGTTGVAAALEGFGFLGLELDASHVEIARARIAYHAPPPVVPQWIVDAMKGGE